MKQIKNQRRILETMEEKELQFYMDEYIRKSTTIDKNTHLAMLDLLNHVWKSTKQCPVIKALNHIEEKFIEKYPEEKSLQELLPQWYTS